jgi:2-polyprenyl-3-methyl-5-hydroxy-6-metoxy-1,4-benzoquinol methylase
VNPRSLFGRISGAAKPPKPADIQSKPVPHQPPPRAPKSSISQRQAELLALNIKNFGHELGRRWRHNHPPRKVEHPPAQLVPWKPSTQADFQSDWLHHWCGALKVGVRPHRKLWEFAWLLQNLHAHGMLAEGCRAIGFGCGQEPLPSFLASRGVEVVATDLEAGEVAGRGWAETGQHAANLDNCFRPELIDRPSFDARVRFETADMTALSPHLNSQFDIAWSVCSCEHLGSIEAGLAFIENSMAVLRPGGISIHTTEFNVLEPDETLDSGPTVLFRRKDFEALAERLTAAGHRIGPLSFDTGSGPLDRYIDLPPYGGDVRGALAKGWTQGGDLPHLKLSVGGYASTCFGVYAIKVS